MTQTPIDYNTAALRMHQNEQDQRDREERSLHDIADYLTQEELDVLMVDADALGTAVYENDIDIWRALVKGFAAVDLQEDRQAIDALREIRSAIHNALYMPTLRKCESRLAEEDL